MSQANQASQHALRAYLYRHRQAIGFSAKQLLSAPFSNLMTIVVIGLALALPACLYVLLQNTMDVTASWQHDAQISLFLKKESSLEQARQLAEQLQLRSDVAFVNIINPDQGLQQLQEQGGFADIINQLPENPLPRVVEVYPMPLINKPAQLATMLEKMEVLEPVSMAKLDMQWLKRLHSILSLAKRSFIISFALICIAVLFVISHTIGLVTQNKRCEIEVYKLLGATNAYIRRPFLYTGLGYGLMGGILAWSLVDCVILMLHEPVMKLAALYESRFVLVGLNPVVGMLLLAAAAGLGLGGSAIAVRRHIRQMEPR